MQNPLLPNNFSANRGLKLVGRCPACEHAYDWRNLQVLGEQAASILAYIECSNCGSAVLSILSLNPMGMSAQALITDLTQEEVSRFLDEEPISTDEVLEWHQSLEDDMFIID